MDVSQSKGCSTEPCNKEEKVTRENNGKSQNLGVLENQDKLINTTENQGKLELEGSLENEKKCINNEILVNEGKSESDGNSDMASTVKEVLNKAIVCCDNGNLKGVLVLVDTAKGLIVKNEVRGKQGNNAEYKMGHEEKEIPEVRKPEYSLNDVAPITKDDSKINANYHENKKDDSKINANNYENTENKASDSSNSTFVKERADNCLKLAQDAFEANNLEKAERLATKAGRIYPSEESKSILAKVLQMKASSVKQRVSKGENTNYASSEIISLKKGNNMENAYVLSKESSTVPSSEGKSRKEEKSEKELKWENNGKSNNLESGKHAYYTMVHKEKEIRQVHQREHSMTTSGKSQEVRKPEYSLITREKSVVRPKKVDSNINANNHDNKKDDNKIIANYHEGKKDDNKIYANYHKNIKDDSKINANYYEDKKGDIKVNTNYYEDKKDDIKINANYHKNIKDDSKFNANYYEDKKGDIKVNTNYYEDKKDDIKINANYHKNIKYDSKINANYQDNKKSDIKINTNYYEDKKDYSKTNTNYRGNKKDDSKINANNHENKKYDSKINANYKVNIDNKSTDSLINTTNREQADYCLKCAKYAFESKDIEKAERLAAKADRMFPSEESKTLLAKVLQMKASSVKQRDSNGHNTKYSAGQIEDKEEAQRSLEIAFTAHAKGDIDKCRRFLIKAQKFDRSIDIDVCDLNKKKRDQEDAILRAKVREEMKKDAVKAKLLEKRRKAAETAKKTSNESQNSEASVLKKASNESQSSSKSYKESVWEIGKSVLSTVFGFGGSGEGTEIAEDCLRKEHGSYKYCFNNPSSPETMKTFTGKEPENERKRVIALKANELENKAMTCYNGGDYKHALVLLDAALVHHPDKRHIQELIMQVQEAAKTRKPSAVKNQNRAKQSVDGNNVNPSTSQNVTHNISDSYVQNQLRYKTVYKTHNSRENTHNSRENTHHSRENTHNSRENTHHSRENTHHSKENTHNSREKTHNSRENTHNSRENTHNSRENTHNSRENTHNSREKTHNSREKTHNSRENTHDSSSNRGRGRGYYVGTENDPSVRERRGSRENTHNSRENTHHSREKTHNSREKTHNSRENTHDSSSNRGRGRGYYVGTENDPSVRTFDIRSSLSSFMSRYEEAKYLAEKGAIAYHNKQYKEAEAFLTKSNNMHPDVKVRNMLCDIRKGK